MSISIKILVLFGLLYVFSQFGTRLSATRALTWWAMGFFLLIASFVPNQLVGLANFFGVELVSNFILASISFFLFVELLSMSASVSTIERNQRHMVSLTAFRSFDSSTLFQNEKAQTEATRVLVALPCFNEQENVPYLVSLLEDLKTKSSEKISYDYCFINDASIDQTPQILKEMTPFNHINHDMNIGVSGVLLTSFILGNRLGVEYIVQCDSDGQHPIEKIPCLVQHAIDSKADITVGSRYIGNSLSKWSDPSTTAIRRLGTKILSWTLRICWPKAQCVDTTSGFRVYSKQARNVLLKRMPETYPEPESLAIVSAARLKISEIPVSMEARKFGESSITPFRSLNYMVKVISAVIGMRINSLIKSPYQYLTEWPKADQSK